MACRPETTGRKIASAPTDGRKTAPARKAASARRATSAAVQLGAYSISGFCQAHALSEAMYYKMRALGLGPDEMEMGRRKGISIESAARWREAREAAARETDKVKNQETAEIA